MKLGTIVGVVAQDFRGIRSNGVVWGMTFVAAPLVPSSLLTASALPTQTTGFAGVACGIPGIDAINDPLMFIASYRCRQRMNMRV